MTTTSTASANQGQLAHAPAGVREAISIAQDTLQLIGQSRPDGSYVHDRETCSTLAIDALARIAHQLAPAGLEAVPSEPCAYARSSGAYTVYTDGGCRPTNPGPAGWGIIIVDGSTVIQEAGGFIGQGTNQIAELEAAIQGLRRTPEGATVELVSDSQYMLKGLTEWRRGWERRGWRNAAGEPVANKDRWQMLFALADKRTVRARWVKGHNGDPFNERADQLATQAINSRRGS